MSHPSSENDAPSDLNIQEECLEDDSRGAGAALDAAWQLAVPQWVSDAGILNEEIERIVQRCFSLVNRRHFVESRYQHLAAQDVDIPLPHDQWLSRPTLLIRMMALLQVRRRMRILELGFGSGYFCAVLAAAGCQVFGVERVGVFAQSSRRVLDTLGHHGVVVRRGEGQKGWPEAAPFDALVVSYPVRSEREIPLEQLAEGGVALAPLVVSTAAQAQTVRLALWIASSTGMRRVLFEEV